MIASLVVVAACSSQPAARSQGTTTTRSTTRILIVKPEIAYVTSTPPAAGTAPGPSQEQENAVVRTRLLKEVEGHYAELTQCFDAGREHDGQLQGRVTVKFTVAPSGDVVGLSDGGSTTLTNKGVISCVQGAFTRMKFSSWEGKAVTAVLPIDFAAPAGSDETN